MEFVDPALGCLNNKQFILEFIQCYRSHRSLWDTTDAAYSSKPGADQYLSLLHIMRKVKPDACIYDVKRKINSLRSAYRRELKKMITAQESDAGKAYKATLWYFDLMRFLGNNVRIFGTKVEQHAVPAYSDEDSCFQIQETFIDLEEDTLSQWAHDKDLVREFIECYRQQRCLWDPTSPLYKKNCRELGYEALLMIMQKRNPKATVNHVKKKINSLRGIYRRELKKVKESKECGGRIYQSTLWYYDLMNFLAHVKTDRENKDLSTASMMYFRETEAQKETRVSPDTNGEEKENLRAFISCFQSHIALWDASSSNYRSKKHIKKALTSLLRILREVKPNATLYDVKDQLKSIKSTYRRYLAQDTATEKCLPRLWYLQYLTFLSSQGHPLESYKLDRVEASAKRVDEEEVGEEEVGEEEVGDEEVGDNEVDDEEVDDEEFGDNEVDGEEIDEEEVVIVKETPPVKKFKRNMSFNERRAEIERTHPSLYLPPIKHRYSHDEEQVVDEEEFVDVAEVVDEEEVAIVNESPPNTSFNKRRAEIEISHPSLYLPPDNHGHSNDEKEFVDEEEVAMINETPPAKKFRLDISFNERRAEIEKTHPSLYLPPVDHRYSQPERRSAATHTMTTVWEEKLNAMPKMQRILAERAINEIIFQGELGALRLDLVQHMSSLYPTSFQGESHNIESP